MGIDMYYVVQTSKPFARAVEDLDAAVRRHRFGVLHVHDIGATLRSKGVPFMEQCKVFDICQPEQAAAVMHADMRLSMALPCRLSVYTDGNRTWIGMIEPARLLRMVSIDPSLQPIAIDVGAQLRRMIDEAR